MELSSSPLLVFKFSPASTAVFSLGSPVSTNGSVGIASPYSHTYSSTAKAQCLPYWWFLLWFYIPHSSPFTELSIPPTWVRLRHILMIQWECFLMFHIPAWISLYSLQTFVLQSSVRFSNYTMSWSHTSYSICNSFTSPLLVCDLILHSVSLWS